MRTTSPNLWVKSSSLRSPVSSVMLGRIVTGGIAKTDKIAHSGRAAFGFNPRKEFTFISWFISTLYNVMHAFDKSVSIQFAEDYPLKLDYLIKDKLALSFILAPRVNND